MKSEEIKNVITELKQQAFDDYCEVLEKKLLEMEEYDNVRKTQRKRFLDSI